MVLAGILGTGSALPEKVITNPDFEKMVETSDQWIIERTGIRERHQAAPHETTSRLSRPGGAQSAGHGRDHAGGPGPDHLFDHHPRHAAALHGRLHSA